MKNDGRIFVFGSNLAGVHGAGAARWAVLHRGAIYGQGVGLQGQSYGIPTKNHRINTLSIGEINRYVQQFLRFAREHPEMKFLVTAIGCGLAGRRPAEIAPMFAGAPDNCELPVEFKPSLDNLNDPAAILCTFRYN